MTMASTLPHAGPLNVLFLCTHNSARSILAEGLATWMGNGRLRGHSAGSQPSGTVNPRALAALRERGCPIDGLHSKSWDEFAQPGATPMDIVITVCGNTARESCPLWPGAPVVANWACRDPSTVTDDEQAATSAFRHTADLLSQRLQRLLARPVESMGPEELAGALGAIARAVPDPLAGTASRQVS